MILILGGSGYIGQSVADAARRRGHELKVLTRREADYTRFEILVEHLRRHPAELLINAAGFTGRPNVDACESAKAETLLGNTLFPQMVAHACLVTETPWAHISSGCIYSGAKISDGGRTSIYRDLALPDIRAVIEKEPICVQGFTEGDTPNFTFRAPPCSFYSGTKALGEEAVAGIGRVYLWRLRIPFDEKDNARNYLSKVQRYPKVYDNVNSLSHRGDFAEACLDLWERRAPFGTYNITNPGFVTTRQVVEMIQKILKRSRPFEFWQNDEEFYRLAAKTPRSNCILDVSKLLATGVRMRPVEEALEAALHEWLLGG